MIICSAYIGITQNKGTMYTKKLSFDTYDGAMAFRKSIRLRMSNRGFREFAYKWDRRLILDYDTDYRETIEGDVVSHHVTVKNTYTPPWKHSEAEIDAALEACVMHAYKVAKKKDVAS